MKYVKPYVVAHTLTTIDAEEGHTSRRAKALLSLMLLLSSIGLNDSYAKEGRNMAPAARDAADSSSRKPELQVIKPGSLPSSVGPKDWFTGTARITPLCKGEEPSCLQCASVSFEPGARTVWHAHPKGQLLIVTEGAGLVQEWGKPVRKIQKGDTIWTPPGVKHWHGGAPGSAMTHTAIQESLNGKVVEWMERVTDNEYKAEPQ